MERAAAILDDFAARTGLAVAVTPRRYLWTDAFAVMTWTGLHERTAERRFLDLALRLVDQVHAVLGAHQPDRAHPTARGLRIGKPLPERGVRDPYDPDLEWERDGQYFPYLTKWMHALQRVAGVTGDERYRGWAMELVQAAHHAFVHPRGMYWKMSIDLSRPLVPSMGAHDPLDGLVEAASLGLEHETRTFARLCEGRRWATSDPLGAGGLLLAAPRLARLGLLTGTIVEDVEASVAAAAQTIGGPARQRLAFRELGLALGLHTLERYAPLAREIENFWLDPASQAAETWTGHLDINAVTLAASLAPEGVPG
ncbi:MAG: hypothetical protein ACT4P4_07960 [Betaproteobacteria bacterium]